MARNNQGDRTAVPHLDWYIYACLSPYSSLKPVKAVEFGKYIHSLYPQDSWNLTKQKQTESAFVYRPIRISVETGAKWVLEMCGSWQFCHFMNIWYMLPLLFLILAAKTIKAFDRCTAYYSTCKLKHINMFAAEMQISLSKLAQISSIFWTVGCPVWEYKFRKINYK